MNIIHRTLDNGLRLQGIQMPGTQAITTMILVGAGSRYETWATTGISHFLEHMFFKGARKYTTPKAVSEAVDSFGGEFNAFTGKEYAGYYVKAGQDHFGKAIDVLSDMLLHSTFPENEIQKERGVILEEMAMYQDAPMYQISWDFERLVFGDQPLGWDQIGTTELVQNVTREQFIRYKKSQYVSDNMVITIAGNINETHLDQIQAAFNSCDGEAQIKPTPYDPSKSTQQINIRHKKTEQYHLAFGCLGISQKDPRYAAGRVLSTIMGGNMSSRMFQRIREQKGLCYSIRTYLDEYTDTGLVVTRAGVRSDAVLDAVTAIREEHDLISREGVTPDELIKAQNYICGKTDLHTEDTEEVAHSLGQDLLLFDQVETFDQWKAKVQAVTVDEVNALAQELFQSQNYRFAGIGRGVSESEIKKILD